MKFFTEVIVEKSKIEIHHKHNLLTIGSCFSENFGNFFLEHFFHVSNHQMGTIFNPHSILKTLNGIKENNIPISETRIVESQGLYFHLDFSSKFYGKSPEELISKIETKVREQSDLFQKVDFIFVTFGTAIVYKDKTSNETVSSCHKVNSDFFHKSKLDPEEITLQWNQFLNQNKNIHFIFTLSPVRHTKDGFVENQESKSILHHAIQIITRNNINSSYFPAFEIIMDELRDYRFYEKDLIHPNSQALEVIQKKFSQSYFDSKTLSIVQEIKKLNDFINHKLIFDTDCKKEELNTKKKLMIQSFLKKYPDFRSNIELSAITSLKK